MVGGMTFLRRALPATVVAAAAALSTGSPASASVDARPHAQVQAHAQGQAAATIRLTVRVAGCDTCEIGLNTAREQADGSVDVWSAEPRQVRDGRATFSVPADLTAGLQVSVSAPWEGGTGYTAVAALRYAGTQAGDRVSFAAARDKRRATGCWAGTSAREDILRIKVRRVTVDGTQGPTAGVMAWAPRTQDWLPPMQRVHDGVLGAQDVALCG